MNTLNGKSILIIDDSAQVRLLVRKILESDGAQVKDVESVADALKELEEQIPNLILSDLQMPGKTGFHFLAYRLRTDKLRSVPTIVLSSLNDKDSIQKAITIGITDYILKPIQASILIQKVRRALNLSAFSKKFDPQNRPKLEITVAAELREISEIGCKVESPIKLCAEENLKIEAELLSRCTDYELVVTRTIPKEGQKLKDGRFKSEVNFIGIGDAFSKSIRAILKGLL